MKHQHLDTLSKATDPLGAQIKLLFTEHHFITIVCAFFVVLMVLSFYRFLRSISPALVTFLLLLVLAVLILHWVATRTEPAFLTPFINGLAPFFPSPNG
jgi:hypothetical protein